jgi:class 3 adenylate cyclase
VNLASRLESVNKYYGTYICVSEDIYELEKENFVFRYLDNIKVA